MSADDIPPGEEPGTDPDELERVMKLGVGNPAWQGLMFRLLLGARLWVPIPAHPEMVGEHLLDTSAGFTWCAYTDDEGTFLQVFTTECMANDTLGKLAQPTPMIAEIPARVLLGMFKDSEMNVRVIASNGTRIVLKPEAIRSLLSGKLTENRGDSGVRQKLTMHPLPADQVPSELREAIRVFCAQRQGAMAVYAFHPIAEETGAVDERDLRFVVRLRDNPGHFFNDFSLMVSRVAPKGLKVAVAAARLDDEEGMAFFQRCMPLWPVV
jgi:hypothetical protein